MHKSLFSALLLLGLYRLGLGPILRVSICLSRCVKALSDTSIRPPILCRATNLYRRPTADMWAENVSPTFFDCPAGIIQHRRIKLLRMGR